MNAISLMPLLLALGQAEAKPATPAAPPPPAAEAPAAAPAVQLTLDAALARAAEANYDLAVARAKLQQARQGVWKAWSGYLPQVTASGAYTRNNVEAAIKLPIAYHVTLDGAGSTTGRTDYPLDVVEATIQKKDQLGAQVQATQALFVPMLWGMINAASHGASAAEQSVEAARREILFGVSQLFYGTASLRKVADVQQRLFETARKHEHDAEVRYKTGTIPKVGLLRAQIERAKAEQDLLRSKNGYESMRLALATALDRPADFEVVDPAEPALPADPAALPQRALEDRPDVKAAREAEAAARGARAGTVGKYLPSVGAFGRWQIANVTGFTGENTAWAVGLAANWNLLDGGLREAELREANAKVAEAEAARRGAEAKATLDVRQATLDLESAQANARKATEQRDLARENQRLIDVSYAAGAATALEQADAQTALSAAEVAAEAEALNARLAALRLLKAAGAFDPAPAR
ncbi:MAG TPA: TolC family protein [Anaeromyxobacteraceae bacterium]|nr:TolC family protein [Anaeromyxobacteraceae bacterium]